MQVSLEQHLHKVDQLLFKVGFASLDNDHDLTKTLFISIWMNGGEHFILPLSKHALMVGAMA